jgi:hypothetical protein
VFSKKSSSIGAILTTVRQLFPAKGMTQKRADRTPMQPFINCFLFEKIQSYLSRNTRFALFKFSCFYEKISLNPFLSVVGGPHDLVCGYLSSREMHGD